MKNSFIYSLFCFLILKSIDKVILINLKKENIEKYSLEEEGPKDSISFNNSSLKRNENKTNIGYEEKCNINNFIFYLI